MKCEVLNFDLHALRSNSVPVYRLYVNDYLMTEHIYTANTFDESWYREIIPFKFEDKNINVRLEWIENPPIEVSVSRIRTQNHHYAVDVEYTKDTMIMNLELLHENK